MSPFVFGNDDGKAGLYGLNNLIFQFNMLSNANRAWRAVRFNTTLPWATSAKIASIESFEESILHFMFLTAHPTLKLNSRNIVPYYEFNAFRTTIENHYLHEFLLLTTL